MRLETRWQALVLTVITSFTGGCVVGPDFERPRAPDLDTYVSQVVNSPDAPVVNYGGKIAADWYTLFHSDALNALVQEALVNNADLEAAQAELRALTRSPASRAPRRMRRPRWRTSTRGSFSRRRCSAISTTSTLLALVFLAALPLLLLVKAGKGSGGAITH